MRAIVKGALIGGGVGALVTTVQATRADDDPPETVAVAALKGAAEGALAGGLIGAFFDWRRSRAEPEPTTLAPAVALAARDAFDSARPALEVAALQAQERARDAVEVARPHVEAATVQARELALEAVEAARPHVEAAAAQAQDRAWEAAERAAPHIQDLVEEARLRAPGIVESTIGDGPVIVVRRPAE
jgi:hypothetical protein